MSDKGENMRKKKFLSALLAVGIAFTLTGCGNKSSDSSVKEESSTAYTTAELAEKITLCGKQLKSPLTFADFGEGFTLDSYAQESIRGAMIGLFYNGEFVCALDYYCTPDEIDENQKIAGIYFTSNDFNKDKIAINGFTANDNFEVLEEKLGAPTASNQTVYTYDTSDNGRLEVIDLPDGSIHSIVFTMEIFENKK